jgi:tRNA-uridine 2-sulfurtransferase
MPAAPHTATGAKPQRIVVAMSGGVDSSVVAGLLKGQGHDVIGITLQLYDVGQATGRTRTCCAGQDIHDARRVAELLDIPHYVLDYEARFRTAVIDQFADSYIAGETPIPCVACNQQVKFLDLLDTARELGADAMATGHYIERRDGPSGPELYRGPDHDRDQSYFLFATTREQLEVLRFPLGTLTKPKVRELAIEMDLPVATKHDSQDICFVPSGNYADVIARLRPDAVAPGDIIHLDGTVLGRHDGIIHYTIGQRRGLGIAVHEPLYVVRLDAPGRRVIVGPRDALLTTALALRDVNWLGNGPLRASAATRSEGLDVYARVRSSQPPQPATLYCTTEAKGAPVRRATVELHGGAHGIAPGQACVLYDGDGAGARVLGGGWIDATGWPATTEGAQRHTNVTHTPAPARDARSPHA